MTRGKRHTYSAQPSALEARSGFEPLETATPRSERNWLNGVWPACPCRLLLAAFLVSLFLAAWRIG